MDNGHSKRPDGSPASREPWSGRRPAGDQPEGDPAAGDPPGGEEEISFDERLRRAEEELRAEQEAASAAAGSGSGPGEWPPRETSGGPPRPGGGIDFAALFVLLDALRRAVPPELQERVTALIREALLTLRSLIDWYLERLDGPEREPQVEDIPID